ncbi:helicase-related protein [Kitasatospora sp. NPDC048286]|uniref:helicase-related protein n=1 Tax=Kitasatospora sp. NPDC048286 TaxID=3364047 RepID=UPI003723AEA1
MLDPPEAREQARGSHAPHHGAAPSADGDHLPPLHHRGAGLRRGPARGRRQAARRRPRAVPGADPGGLAQGRTRRRAARPGTRRVRAQRATGRAVDCRVLGEGVDIRAVDSVALVDPKGAPHDIVQAIGRALRQQPNEGKPASLIVPVFLKEGERSQDKGPW